MRVAFAVQPAKLPDHSKSDGSEKGRFGVGESWVASIASTFRKVGEMKLEAVLQSPGNGGNRRAQLKRAALGPIPLLSAVPIKTRFWVLPDQEAAIVTMIVLMWA